MQRTIIPGLRLAAASTMEVAHQASIMATTTRVVAVATTEITVNSITPKRMSCTISRFLSMSMIGDTTIGSNSTISQLRGVEATVPPERSSMCIPLWGRKTTTTTSSSRGTQITNITKVAITTSETL